MEPGDEITAWSPYRADHPFWRGVVVDVDTKPISPQERAAALAQMCKAIIGQVGIDFRWYLRAAPMVWQEAVDLITRGDYPAKTPTEKYLRRYRRIGYRRGRKC